MIRKIKSSDLDTICRLIHENLRTINSLDYTEHVINFMISHYSRKKVEDLINSEEHFYVFEDDGAVLGCILLDNCEAKALYVDPQAHNKGIGKKLMLHIENLNLCSEISLYASESAYIFYKKLDYDFISLADDPDYGPSHFMKKAIVSTL